MTRLRFGPLHGRRHFTYPCCVFTLCLLGFAVQVCSVLADAVTISPVVIGFLELSCNGGLIFPLQSYSKRLSQGPTLLSLKKFLKFFGQACLFRKTSFGRTGKNLLGVPLALRAFFLLVCYARKNYKSAQRFKLNSKKLQL